jgi:hypothetical protein
MLKNEAGHKRPSLIQWQFLNLLSHVRYVQLKSGDVDVRGPSLHFTSRDAMSIVIMKPFVPLNSKALSPRR